MRWLFSLFPEGLPGLALLLLRVWLGLLILDRSFPSPAVRGGVWLVAVSIGVAVALAAGVLTPVACTLCAALELSRRAFTGPFPVQPHVCVLLDVLALGLLGPGGYFVDAPLSGRS